ncbi:hypothetical protein ACIOC2_12190 [Streptomyces sp. NPDC088337]|uniref:hypothetical protein n=1 Tax=unclassified Streptomyces TaxID=2593676 RepID=UPI0038182B4B
MTHCDGYRAAAVANAGEVRGVGIDAAHHLPLPEGLFASMALPAEQRRDAELRRLAPGVHQPGDSRLSACGG